MYREGADEGSVFIGDVSAEDIACAIVEATFAKAVEGPAPAADEDADEPAHQGPPNYAEKADAQIAALERVASVEGIDVLVSDLKSIRADARYVGDFGLRAAKKLRDVYHFAELTSHDGFDANSQCKLTAAVRILERAVSVCEKKLEDERAASGS